ncbi:hypothetical protein D9756_010495 [Leucocoprinus leucothites]|uniref:Transmembrane protein n=1 Tax=Leucocoprinus leucothites TaxID=201217 RepID=A0A8H5CUT4_9AGAR|nr:hypothetical protein D9756_010495 [Leucoagaricus leucothites]
MAQRSSEVLALVVSRIQRTKYSLVAPYPIVIWELIAVLPREIGQIYLSRWTPLKCIYLAGRFLPIVLWPIIVWLMVGDHTLEECQGKKLLAEHLIVMVLQLVPHSVLAIRAYAYTGRSRKVRILLALGTCAYIGTQIWAYLIKETCLDPSLFQLLGRTGCYRDSHLSRHPFACVIIAGTIVDGMSIALTVVHAVTTMGINGKLRMVFLLQGLSLFTFMFCVNIMTSVSLFRNRPSESWEVACFALVLLVPNSVACRFILELREITAGQAETDIIMDRFGRAVDDCLAQGNAQREE